MSLKENGVNVIIIIIIVISSFSETLFLTQPKQS